MSLRVPCLVLVLLFMWAIPVPPSLAGQEPVGSHTLILRDVPVLEALERVVSVTGLDLLFGSEVTEAVGNRRVFCRAERETAEGVLSCVVRPST